MKASPYYPLFLDLSGSCCVVIGGGPVAERKVRALLTCGANVRVVSPSACKGLRTLGEMKKIKLKVRAYQPADLEGASLAFAATNDEATNKRVSRDAKDKRIPVNVADSPDLCDFIVPAVVRRDPILVAISTSGMLPMLARRLRQEIERQLPKDLARYVTKVGRLRKLLIERVGDRKTRQKILKEIGNASISEIAGMSMRELRARFLEANSKS